MYELPPDFDPSVFTARRLDYIAFSENTVHLSFDAEDGLAVTVEGLTVHEAVGADGARVLHEERVPAAETRLLQLIGKTVLEAHVEEGVTLRLEFDDHQVLTCVGKSARYEMYRITGGNPVRAPAVGVSQ